MRIPQLLALAATALMVPAVASADIGPHSNFYDQHPGPSASKNDVTVLLDRKTQKATVDVTNHCLGTEIDGGRRFPKDAEIHVRVQNGRLSFNGKATVITKTATTRIPARLSAAVEPKKVVGDATFPHTACGTIHFVAKRIEHTK